MKCPYCDKEMQQGYVQCRDGLHWTPKKQKIAAIVIAIFSGKIGEKVNACGKLKKACLILTIMLCFFLSACSHLKRVEEGKKWDCSVICAEESREDSYIITYSDIKISSNTGTLSFQNQNEFDVVVHLLTNGQEERTAEIAAGGISVLYQVEKEVDYTVGCHADVTEGTEIRLMVYDGENTETFSAE